MHFIYVISSTSKNYIYVGITSDLEKKLVRHNAGLEKDTKAYRPFILICKEGALTLPEARAREKYWNSAAGKEKLRKIRNASIGDLSIDW